MQPSQNLPLPPRIPSPLLNNYNIMRPFQALPPSPLPEYNPSFDNYMRPSQNLPLPLRICLLLITICDTPTIYPYIPEYTPPFLTTICDPPRIYPYLPEYTPPLLTTICDPPRIYLSLPESTPPPFLTTIYNPTPPPPSTIIYMRPT